MNLDKLQIKASVRSGWQAMDLGFLMARQWWRTLFMSAAIPSILLFIPLLVIFFQDPFWALFIVWWLKPFWERVPLYIASRRLFSDESFGTQIFSQFMALYRKDFFAWLIWRRFSFNRAFDAPVTVLEELKGQPRRQRLNVLHGKHTDMALANQIACLCFELITAMGLFAIIMFLTPETISDLFYDSGEDGRSLAEEWIYCLCGFVAMLVVLPFHTMAGFALYLNRRIELEAWDIEIAFRSLAQRKQKPATSLVASVIIACCVTFFTIGLPGPAYAATTHDHKSAGQLIDEVLKGEDYGQERTVKKWRFKNWVEENEDKIPDWMIDFVEWWENNIDLSDSESALRSTAFWLKVLLIGLFIYLLVYLFYRFRGPLSRLRRQQKQQTAPDIMFGLDVRAESLPDDVPAQVMQLWQQSQHREALGLLYRASLSRLIEQHELAFKSSHTEAECAALVRECGIDSLSIYFSNLTQVWRRLAYGHQVPEITILQQLCTSWSKEMTDVAY